MTAQSGARTHPQPAPTTAHPTPPDRLAIERISFGPGITGSTALACFYLIGGALTLASLAVPGWDERSTGGVLSVGIATATSGVLVWSLRSHLSSASCHILVALGSLLIGASMVWSGGGVPTATFGVFFVWVAVYAAVFFAPLPAFLQVSWAGSVHVMALIVTEETFVLAQTLVLFGTATATALVVGGLVRQVRNVADTDALTGLPNRRFFDAHLDMEMARAVRTGRPLALLAMDLDGFKQVNDTEGHAAGDRLLIAAGKAWQGVLRDGELLARSGGDEFVVLLAETDELGAARVAERLEHATPRPLGVSIGAAVSDGGETADVLLQRADRALYRQKGLAHRL